MRNQRIYPWMVLRDRVEDPGSSGDGDPPISDPGSVPTEDPNPNPSNTGIESPFAGIAGLEGMSPAQVAERMRVMEATVKEQGRALNLAARQVPATPTPAPAPDPEIDATAFFAEPGKALRTMEDRIANKLRNDLQEIISPFRQNLADTKTAQAWQAVRDRYPDVDTYQDYIQTQLDQRGISDPEAGTIRLLYLDAKDTLGVTTSEPAPKSPSNDPGRPAPPQHPASRQPINPTNQGQPKVRQLTESERTVARMNKMSDEEYLKWLEVDDENVVTSEIGVKK